MEGLLRRRKRRRKWLRDNHHVVRAQLQEIRRNLRAVDEEPPTGGGTLAAVAPYAFRRAISCRRPPGGSTRDDRRFADAYQDITPPDRRLWPFLLVVAGAGGICAAGVQTLRAKQEREAQAFAAELIAESAQAKTSANPAGRKGPSTFVVETSTVFDQSVSSTAAKDGRKVGCRPEGSRPTSCCEASSSAKPSNSCRLPTSSAMRAQRWTGRRSWKVSRVERIPEGSRGAYGDMDLRPRSLSKIRGTAVETLGGDEIEIAGARRGLAQWRGRAAGIRSTASSREISRGLRRWRPHRRPPSP